MNWWTIQGVNNTQWQVSRCTVSVTWMTYSIHAHYTDSSWICYVHHQATGSIADVEWMPSQVYSLGQVQKLHQRSNRQDAEYPEIYGWKCLPQIWWSLPPYCYSAAISDLEASVMRLSMLHTIRCDSTAHTLCGDTLHATMSDLLSSKWTSWLGDFRKPLSWTCVFCCSLSHCHSDPSVRGSETEKCCVYLWQGCCSNTYTLRRSLSTWDRA